jgi:SAM-dependent methyltransferase
MAADLGCGLGFFCVDLAQYFDHVEACDFSAKSLTLASKRCEGLANIDFHKIDLSIDEIPFAPVDFVLCVNVLIMPDIDQLLRTWRTVTNQVKESGKLLIVVPSLESIHLQRWATIQDELESGRNAQIALQESFPIHSDARNLHQGVHLLDEQPTKHYLKEELEKMLHLHHFDVLRTEKLNYFPSSEPETTWDWLVVAQRHLV